MNKELIEEIRVVFNRRQAGFDSIDESIIKVFNICQKDSLKRTVKIINDRPVVKGSVGLISKEYTVKAVRLELKNEQA